MTVLPLFSIIEIAGNDFVKYIWLNEKLSILLHRSVPYLKTTDVHNLGVDGYYAKVGVIDTGVSNHPNLWIWNRADYASCWPVNDPNNNDGHGTHVAGIVVSRNSTFKGMAPMAWIISAKIMGSWWLW